MTLLWERGCHGGFIQGSTQGGVTVALFMVERLSRSLFFSWERCHCGFYQGVRGVTVGLFRGNRGCHGGFVQGERGVTVALFRGEGVSRWLYKMVRGSHGGFVQGEGGVTVALYSGERVSRWFCLGGRGVTVALFRGRGVTVALFRLRMCHDNFVQGERVSR